MAWWDHGYPGGHMVPVPGFPRPLYPPDAHGYEPSSDGPDVLAYKRTISRAGRWPGGDPWGSAFDDSYSNAFAHGKPPGNVSESGVAGVQRQQHIHPPSGYVGLETFKTLRSIIIPDPLPHAGSYAMDVTAQNLIGEAYAMFNTPEDTVATVRAAALAMAESFIGYTENPPGSNCTTFGSWYGMDGQPWCLMFVTYCYELGKTGGSPSFARGSRYAYCPYLLDHAENRQYGLSLTSSPVPGDVVLYSWDDDVPDHVGLFLSGNTTSWYAIEGNTSTSNNSNGGQVMRRYRSRYDAHAVWFVRVAEP